MLARALSPAPWTCGRRVLLPRGWRALSATPRMAMRFPPRVAHRASLDVV